ncbi:MAG: DUF2804 domain-containing protein [Thermoleophilia bacterium]|nr:DUF2804 domain-containing protein [Thermoleophilia bacterium]
MSELELTTPYALVGADGRLNPAAVGWSRRPLCDATLPGPAGRRKRWNYWSFATPELYFVIAVVDADYMCLAFAHLLMFSDLRWRQGRLTLPLVARPSMGGRVADEVVFRWRGRRIEMLPRGEGVEVVIDWPGFDGGDLRAELRTEPLPGQESINVTIPWSAKRYHFTSKQPATPVAGTVRVGGVAYDLGGRDCFAALDFARGVWRYDSTWNWISASGRDAQGRVAGLNLGAGWTDGTPMTENGVIVDGLAHKIGRAVRFDYDQSDLMKPWRIYSDSAGNAGRLVDLEVRPFHHHRLNVDLGILRSRLDQVFGRVTGTVALPEGPVRLEGLLATCEEQRARW